MAAAAAALASSPLVHHLTAATRLRLPRPRASVSFSRWACPRGAYLDWRPLRRCDRMRRFSVDEGGGGGGEADGEKRSDEEPAAAAVEAKAGAAEEAASERSRSGSFSSSSSPSSSATPGVSSEPPLLSFSVDSIDTVKLLELLGPEKVDPADVKAIKEKFFGYTTFWLTREEPFGDLGEGVLFVGNLRGNKEEIFGKLQQQLRELTGDKYNLFMVEEPNSEEDDPRGGPRVSFGLLRREVSEPGPTTLWQYVISLLLFLLTVFSCIELGIASKISSLPPDIVAYFTDPNATGPPPDMQLLLPFVESALPVAYGVLAIQLFHEVGHFLAAYPKVKLSIPFFIPNFTLGSFGSITQFKSILPDRKARPPHFPPLPTVALRVVREQPGRSHPLLAGVAGGRWRWGGAGVDLGCRAFCFGVLPVVGAMPVPCSVAPDPGGLIWISLFFLDLLHLLWSELRTKGRAATASNKVAGLSVFKIYISLAFPSAGRGGEGRKGMEMQISTGEKVLSSFLLLPGRTAWDWSQIQRPFVAFQLAGALLRMEPVAVTGFHEHLPHHGSWLRLVLPLPFVSPHSLDGRGGEGRRRRVEVLVVGSERQRVEFELRSRILPSVGQSCRRYLWPRGLLRASVDSSPRILLPPRWEALGLQHGDPTPSSSQVVPSPRWSWWSLTRGRQWQQWRWTRSRFTFSCEVLFVIFEGSFVFSTF